MSNSVRLDGLKPGCLLKAGNINNQYSDSNFCVQCGICMLKCTPGDSNMLDFQIKHGETQIYHIQRVQSVKKKKNSGRTPPPKKTTNIQKVKREVDKNKSEDWF